MKKFDFSELSNFQTSRAKDRSQTNNLLSTTKPILPHLFQGFQDFRGGLLLLRKKIIGIVLVSRYFDHMPQSHDVSRFFLMHCGAAALCMWRTSVRKHHYPPSWEEYAHFGVVRWEKTCFFLAHTSSRCTPCWWLQNLHSGRSPSGYAQYEKDLDWNKNRNGGMECHNWSLTQFFFQRFLFPAKNEQSNVTKNERIPWHLLLRNMDSLIQNGYSLWLFQ